ncbi:MAG: hypothetical protein P4L90_09150, partial [Rhodopila sp.]|nr:hypothetical protein [Rhodopila sp.]
MLFGVVAWQDRISVMREAEQDIRNTTTIYQENAHTAFETHKLVASLVNEHIRGMNWDQISESEPLHQYLASVVHDFPKMQSLWLADPSGLIRNSSAVFPSPPVSVADRDYFIALRERDTGMFFGRPVHGRILADDIFNV